MLEFANEPNNPCYTKDDEFLQEEQHWCVINQNDFNESEMLYIPSQREWVCKTEIDEYLQMHYIHAELCVYNKIRNEVDKLLLINKK